MHICGFIMLEKYFQKYRQNVIGIDQEFETAYGKQKIVYADWTASGRLYRPIEEKLKILRSRDNPWGFYHNELTKNQRDKKQVFDFTPTRRRGRVPQRRAG